MKKFLRPNQVRPKKKLTAERYAYLDYLKRARSNQQNLRKTFYPQEKITAHGGLMKYLGFHKEDFVEKAKNLYEELVKTGDLRKGEALRVLDVGCGYGVFLDELKKTLEREHGIKVEATGVTLSPLGRQFTSTKQLQSSEPYFPRDVKLHVGYMEKLPKTWTNTFHLVVSTRAIQYSYDKLKAVEEMRRVLHPSGEASVDLGPARMINGVYPVHWKECGYDFSATHWDFPLIKFTKHAKPMPFKLAKAFVEMGGNIQTHYAPM